MNITALLFAGSTRPIALRLAAPLLAVPLLACSVTNTQRGPTFAPSSRWVLLPIQNHSGVPQAGEQVGAIQGGLARTRGLSALEVCPDLDPPGAPPELDEGRRFDRSLAWARARQYTLGLTGSVEEWRYKTGAEAEPAVAINLQIIDIASGNVVWSAVGGAPAGGARPWAGPAKS